MRLGSVLERGSAESAQVWLRHDQVREEEMADLSIELASRLSTPDLLAEFLRVVDPDGKSAPALDALGPVVERDVVILDAGGGVRAAQLARLGARVTALVPPDDPVAVEPLVRLVEGTAEATGLPAESADVVVSFWSAFRGPDEAQLAEAFRILRPDGRLLVVHDYGRDDVCRLWPEAFEREIEWSKRNGPFLSLGFRIRVIHCWWTFESMAEAERLLGAAFGEAGVELAGRMRRPRLEYNIAIYHRAKPGRPEEAAD